MSDVRAQDPAVRALAGQPDHAGGRTPEPVSGGLVRLLYSSVASTDLSARELDALLGVARTRNARDDITGMLWHLHDEAPGSAFFVQVLEGPGPAVERVYGKIQHDELHHTLTLLSNGPADNRMFSEWSMGLTHLTGRQTAHARRDLAAPSSRNAIPVPISTRQWITDPRAMKQLMLSSP